MTDNKDWKASIARRQAALRRSTPKAFDHAKANIGDIIARVGEPIDEDGHILPYRRPHPALISVVEKKEHRKKNDELLCNVKILSETMSWRSLSAIVENERKPMMLFFNL